MGAICGWRVRCLTAVPFLIAAASGVVYSFTQPQAGSGASASGLVMAPVIFFAGFVREGVVGGIIGGATVAVWFVSYDTATDRPLYTPALLRAAMLKGLRDPSTLHISTAVVLGYTVLHAAAFVLFGILAAVLLALAEREPMLLLGVFVLFTCFEVFFFSAVMLVDQVLLASLGWWTIFVANILAAITMLAYFLPRHRHLRGRLVEHWESQH